MLHEKVLKTKPWLAFGQFLSRSFVLLGLPLLAWEMDDLAGFFANQIRISFAFVVIAQALIHSWMVYITPLQLKYEPRIDLAYWHSYMFEAIFILAAYGDRRNVMNWSENSSLRWAGLGIYLIGAIFSVLANITWVNHLQKEAECTVDNPVLLVNGPFRLIRYPTLLCLVFFCLGFAITFRSWIGLALMLPLIGAIINRINNWEKVFAERYKDVWILRHHTSKRIIPYLY